MVGKQDQGSNPKTRLDSWDSIAKYLGRSARTIQRWHAAYGLPIHRIGGNTGLVFAYTTEVDEWMWNRDRQGLGERTGLHHSIPFPAQFQPGPLDAGLVSESTRIPDSATRRSAELTSFAYNLAESLSHSNVQVIARLFREAIDLDPCNAEAFAGLSMILITEGIYGDLPMPTAITGSKAALERAQELDPKAQRAACVVPWLKMISERDWAGACVGFAAALERFPSSAGIVTGQALLHVAADASEEASRTLMRLMTERPLNTRVVALHCWTEYLSGQYVSALAQVQEARLSGHSGPVLDAVEAFASVQMRDLDDAVRRIEELYSESPDHWVLCGALAYVYGASGQGKRAMEIVNRMTDPGKFGSGPEPYGIAIALLGLDERHDAVQWLEKAYMEGSIWSLGFPADPMLSSLRNDPCFRLFWSKVTYPDAMCAAPMEHAG